MTFGIYRFGLGAWTRAASSEVLELTFPPASFTVQEGVCRQGMAGSTLLGCYIAIPGTGATQDTYVYFTHDVGGSRFVGIDPGDSDSSLDGYTGVEVQLVSGSRTSSQVASAVHGELDALGIYDEVTLDSDTVTIVGGIDAAAAFTGGSYDSRGGGTIDDEYPRGGKVIGFTNYTQNATFAIDTARAQKFRPTDIPSSSFRVVGYRVKWGTSHTGQIQAALYQGGVGYNYHSASLLANMGRTSGSAVSAPVDVLFEPDNYVEVDPTAGDLWICWMGDGATSPIASFSSTGAGVGAASDFDHNTADSNNAIWVLSGTPPSGSTGTFPAALPARGAAFAFKTAFQLIIQEPPYYGDLTWKTRFGLMMSSSLAGTSTMAGVFTSTAFTVPNVLGLKADRVYVNYAAHDVGEQFRLEWWEGGASATNISGSTLVWDAGQTTGSATSWVGVVNTGSNALTPNARLWMSVKALSGDSSIRFGGAGIGYESANDPAAFYGNAGTTGAASESEFVAPDGNFSHDPSVQSGNPFNPSGTNVNNGNSVGVYGIAKVTGFSKVANP